MWTVVGHVPGRAARAGAGAGAGIDDAVAAAARATAAADLATTRAAAATADSGSNDGVLPRTGAGASRKFQVVEAERGFEGRRWQRFEAWALPPTW